MSQQGDDLTTVIITGCISLDIIGLGGGKEQVTGYCATPETYPYSSWPCPGWLVCHGGTLWWGDTAQSNLRRAHVTHLLTHSARGTIMISQLTTYCSRSPPGRAEHLREYGKALSQSIQREEKLPKGRQRHQSSNPFKPCTSTMYHGERAPFRDISCQWNDCSCFLMR
jgi:hypothetical protein